MTKAFVAIFYLLGSPQAVVGPPVYGGPTRHDCVAYAQELIRNIKRGAELMGGTYTPIEFRCEPNKAVK